MTPDVRRDVVENKAVCFEQVGRFARILPPTGDFAVTDLVAVLNEICVGIGNFKLPPCARLDVLHRFENMMIIDVNSRHRKTALRVLRLFLDTDDLAVLDDRNAEPFRVVHPREGEEAVASARLEFVDETLHAADDHVIAEIEDEIVLADEFLRNPHDVGETERGLLRNVGDLHPPLLSVPDGALNFVAVGIANDADLLDTGIDCRFDCVMQNGFIGNRDEMLVLRVRERAETRASSAAGDQSFHCLFFFVPGYDLINVLNNVTIFWYSCLESFPCSVAVRATSMPATEYIGRNCGA